MDVLRQFLCIHFPHKVSAVMLGLLSHPQAVANLIEVIGPDVKAMQSMLFVKSEGKPGQAWHQDEYFIPTRDHSLTAIWIALDDANVTNGCLWVLPGSHRAGVIYPEREIDDLRFDCTTEAYQFPYRDEDSVPLEVAAGSGCHIRRLSTPSVVAEQGPWQPAPGHGQPLHERPVAPAVETTRRR